MPRSTRRTAARRTFSLLENLESRRLMDANLPGDPDPIEPDFNEPNDSFVEATELGGFGGNGGTIHRFSGRSDVDYFRFVAPTSTTVSVRLSFLHQSGDLNLTMFDGARNQIGFSNSSDSFRNFERITLPVQAGQAYFVKVAGISSPDYTFNINPLTANFDWSMPRRFGSVDQFGLPVAPNTRDYVMPNPVFINGVETARFPVQFTIPNGPTGGDVTYTYNITSPTYSDSRTLAGTTTNFDLPNGTYNVTLTASADGSSVSTTQTVPVKNYLVAAVGDSYGSGEGNPHSPAQYDFFGFATRGAIWAQGGNDTENTMHRMAHRSTKAGVAQMALELENADPKTSVTFVFLNGTGSTVTEGVLGPRPSGDPGAPGTVPAQTDRLAELTAGRRIDSLFVSIGGNDLGFADILADLVKNDPINPFGNYEQRITEIIQRSQGNLQDLVQNRYPALNNRLDDFDIGQIYLTEYPDLSKQSDGQIAQEIIGDVAPGLEVDRHELTRLVEELLPSFIGAMKTAAANFGWNYVDGVLAAFANHGYGDWFRTASDSIVLQGPLGNRNTITPLDKEQTKGTMHPIEGGLFAQRDAMLNDVRRANLVTSLFSVTPGAQTNNNGVYTITITNNSFLTSAPASVGAIYLSGDASVTTSDTRVLTFNVPALAPGQSVTLSGAMPSLSDPYRTNGNRVFVAPVLDVNNNVAESDEVDNRVFSASKIAVFQSELDIHPTDGTLNPRFTNVGQTLGGRLGIDEIIGRADVDVFAVNLTAGQAVDIDIDVTGILDTYVRVYETAFGVPIGPPLAFNDNGFAPGETLNTGDSYLRFTPQFSQRYLIVVSHVANQNADPVLVTGRNEGATGEYTMTVAAPADATPPTVLGSSFDPAGARQELKFTFSENVGASLSAADLVLRNLTTNQVVPAGAINVSYDAGTNTATFTFAGFANGALPDGNYRATIAAGSVSDGAGNGLAADAVSDLFSLAGDANRDRRVDITDFGILASNFNKPGTLRLGQGDFNYDARVDVADFALLAGNFNKSLPASTAAATTAGSTAQASRGASVFARSAVQTDPVSRLLTAGNDSTIA